MKNEAIIGLCTCRNPSGLKKVLAALAANSAGIKQIIVVDNDTRLEGRKVCSDFELNLPIMYVEELRSGIPFARNAIIRSALLNDHFNYLMMIDDDEYPSEDWIAAMVAAHEQSGAAIVSGPVVPVFEAPPPTGISQDYFVKTGGIKLDRKFLIQSTANISFSESFLRGWKSDFFNENFAHTGGSDTEFLRRTFSANVKHAVAPGATVFEDIPPNRATIEWLKKRAHRNGNVITKIRLKSSNRYALAATDTLKGAASLARTAINLAVRRDIEARYRFDIALARIAGKLDALFGQDANEYTKENYRS